MNNKMILMSLLVGCIASCSAMDEFEPYARPATPGPRSGGALSAPLGVEGFFAARALEPELTEEDRLKVVLDEVFPKGFPFDLFGTCGDLQYVYLVPEEPDLYLAFKKRGQGVRYFFIDQSEGYFSFASVGLGGGGGYQEGYACLTPKQLSAHTAKQKEEDSQYLTAFLEKLGADWWQIYGEGCEKERCTTVSIVVSPDEPRQIKLAMVVQRSEGGIPMTRYYNLKFANDESRTLVFHCSQLPCLGDPEPGITLYRCEKSDGRRFIKLRTPVVSRK